MSGPTILPWNGKWPKIADSAFIAPNATIIGDVEIGPDSSIWFGVVIRGDVHEIRIGARTNVQDNSVVHATQFLAGTYIGDDVTIGHAAVLHACTLHNGSFVGMQACVLDKAVIETGGMLAAGALLSPGKVIASGELWAGNPAKKLRDMAEKDQTGIYRSAAAYAQFGKEYRDALSQG